MDIHTPEPFPKAARRDGQVQVLCNERQIRDPDDVENGS